jgi:hypothetical protein
MWSTLSLDIYTRGSDIPAWRSGVQLPNKAHPIPCPRFLYLYHRSHRLLQKVLGSLRVCVLVSVKWLKDLLNGGCTSPDPAKEGVKHGHHYLGL